MGDRAEAERALARLVTEIDDGRHGTTDHNLGQLCDRWLDHHGPNLSPTTVRRHEVTIRNHLKGTRLGSVPIRKLRTADLDRFYGKLRQRGRRGGIPSPHT